MPSKVLKGLLKDHVELLPKVRLVNDASAWGFRSQQQQGDEREAEREGRTERALKSNREFAAEDNLRVADEDKCISES